MSPLQIRPATSSDVEHIVALVDQMHDLHVGWNATRWTTAAPLLPAYARWIRELIASDGQHGLVAVATVDAATIGFLVAEVMEESTHHWSPQTIYLHDIFVAPEHRRRGGADGLMKAVMEWSQTSHPSLQLRLMTAAQNEPARAFFAKYGFRACSVEMLKEP